MKAGVLAIFVLLMILVFWMRIQAHRDSIERFRSLANKELALPRTECEVVEIFGKPNRIRHGADYFVYAYDCPGRIPFWQTECLVRFGASGRKTTAWQLNSD